MDGQFQAPISLGKVHWSITIWIFGTSLRNKMKDFFYIVHYIVYRWYRIHGEDHLMSLLYAGGLQMLLSFILIVNIDYFVCLFLDIPPQIDKPFAWGYIIFGVFFEYIIFYRNGRYKEIFSEYDRQRFTSRMKFKCKAAKIFNFSLLFLDLSLLCLVGYCNHH